MPIKNSRTMVLLAAAASCLAMSGPWAPAAAGSIEDLKQLLSDPNGSFYKGKLSKIGKALCPLGFRLPGQQQKREFEGCYLLLSPMPMRFRPHGAEAEKAKRACADRGSGDAEKLKWCLDSYSSDIYMTVTSARDETTKVFKGLTIGVWIWPPIARQIDEALDDDTYGLPETLEALGTMEPYFKSLPGEPLYDQIHFDFTDMDVSAASPVLGPRAAPGAKSYQVPDQWKGYFVEGEGLKKFYSAIAACAVAMIEQRDIAMGCDDQKFDVPSGVRFALGERLKKTQ